MTFRFCGFSYQTINPLSPSPDLNVQIEDTFITKIRTTIESHLKDPGFDIPRLCRAIGMSRAHLHRKIKSLANRSTSQYIRFIRLHHAKKLLETSNLNVSEVANEVGFRDPKYFSRSFSEEFGISPKNLRHL